MTRSEWFVLFFLLIGNLWLVTGWIIQANDATTVRAAKYGTFASVFGGVYIVLAFLGVLFP